MKSLFSDIPVDLPAELSATLLQGQSFRVERIVSHGQCSPPGFWYDQAQHEWVVVLKGKARLRFEGEPDTFEMGPGDYLTIPPGKRHRVEWTTPDEPTIWLAIHFSDRP